ncbi:hypothetical protein [Breznakiella homolactica]|uniref:Xaa-Pro aminopeptidase n=1 Tax=Breznakiella homolactica TaxID=2798577 RepID=A0A7T7XRE0_9SPIR|nr:hypothetical protein [Breznakiella homolactica]QQO11093.1 hypothetical protein JFL75_09295 [Breznakiella homolactica]
MKIEEIIVPGFPSEMIHESIVRIAPADTYLGRINRVLEKVAEMYGATHVFVYGDREHFANIHYFTGYDPRFEEALLILSKGHEPLILLGNEGWAYSEIIPYSLRRVLYQSFSLAGQPRNGDIKAVLPGAFKQAGISASSTVGIVGLKYYVSEESGDPAHQIDIPRFLTEALEAFAPGAAMVNVTDIMIHPAYGLRTQLDIDEMAVLELAETKSSRSAYNVMRHLEPGMSEIEASAYFCIDGNPLVAHPNLNFTLEDTRRGLVSPGSHRLAYGDIFNIGIGYRSSMFARTSMYARSTDDIRPEWRDIMEKIFIPYFKVVVTWYENLTIGATGSAVIKEIRRQVPEYDRLGVGLNPGHLIHNDEWTSSIFTDTADYAVKDGMAVQCDIIACPEAYPGVHIEDGVIIAGQKTRDEFKRKYPEAWNRIEARRRLMKDLLNIQIGDDLLPLSDLPGCLSPWNVNPHQVLGVR